MFYASFAAFASGAGFGRRRRRALAAVALWLWSSWVIAGGCCCEPVQSAAAAAHPHSGNLADEHGHDHGHSVASAAASFDAGHSQEGMPLGDCGEIKAPPHSPVSNEAAAPSLPFPDHLAVLPAQVPGPVWSSDAHKPWPLPPSPSPARDLSLETIRLLL